MSKAKEKETEIGLAQAALQDPLTGLGNRKRFSQRLSTILGAPQRTGRDALMFIDVDEFRLVNDTKGHAAGDQTIKSQADNLRRALADPDAIYQVGGDEFCIILQ